MTDREGAGQEFLALWPTVVLQREIPGHAEANRALLAVVERLEGANRDLTTDYLGADFLALPDPPARWLKQCVNVTVRDYLAHLGMRYEIRWTLQGWANVNRFGDYHDYHNHPRAYLSGTYYVQVPEDVEALETRKDVRPGRISLYDPRGAVNMTAIKGDPNVEAEHTITPRPGLMLLWPAFVHHFVHPNLSREKRISISFNVMLSWSDDYLPSQM